MRMDIAASIQAPRSRDENRVFRRESLIHAAIVTVARHDLAGATVERICRAAGASRGLIAHYFASKEELLLTAAGETFDEQAMAVKRRIATDRSLGPEARVRLMARSSFEAPIFSPAAIAAWQAFTNASRAQPAFLAVTRRVSEGLRSIYAEVFAEAAVAKDLSLDAAEAAQGLIIVVDGLWTSLATGRDALGLEDALRIAERYIDGCLAVEGQA